METETIALSPAGSTRRFNVHRGVLEKQCKTLYRACKSFKEGEDGIYNFQDVSEGTLIRFIQWAYKSTYEEEVDVSNGPKQSDDTRSGDGKPKTSDGGEESIDIDGNHPLLSHGRLYVFADKYLIRSLKRLALQKINSKLRTWGQVNDLPHMTSVIELLDLMSSNLTSDDKMLDFLGKYSAYNLMNLRQQQYFNEVAGSLSAQILRYVIPWNGDPFRKDDGTYD